MLVKRLSNRKGAPQEKHKYNTKWMIVEKEFSQYVFLTVERTIFTAWSMYLYAILTKDETIFLQFYSNGNWERRNEKEVIEITINSKNNNRIITIIVAIKKKIKNKSNNNSGKSR